MVSDGGSVRPLYYVGRPTEQQRIALRRGKELLGVDFMVMPEEAKPGVDAFVLAFEEPQFYIEKYAKLTPPYTPARMAKALSEVLGLEEPVHLTTGAELLSGWLGTSVVDLGEEEI